MKIKQFNKKKEIINSGEYLKNFIYSKSDIVMLTLYKE
jgi:hypothetical protein